MAAICMKEVTYPMRGVSYTLHGTDLASSPTNDLTYGPTRTLGAADCAKLLVESNANPEIQNNQVSYNHAYCPTPPVRRAR
eukprot:958526-Rhodomonas_salina.2